MKSRTVTLPGGHTARITWMHPNWRWDLYTSHGATWVGAGHSLSPDDAEADAARVATEAVAA